MLNIRDYEDQIQEQINSALQHPELKSAVFVAETLTGEVFFGWNTPQNIKLGEWEAPVAHGWGYSDFKSYVYVWKNGTQYNQHDISNRVVYMVAPVHHQNFNAMVTNLDVFALYYVQIKVDTIGGQGWINVNKRDLT